MSGSGATGPLQRAHALSAQANQLLNSSSPTLANLTSALDAYRQAADLFSAAATEVDTGSDTLKTLQLLAAQHRKLVRDVERRIAQANTASPPTQPQQHPSIRRAATVPAPSSSGSSGPTPTEQQRHSRPITGDRPPISPIKRPIEPAGLAAISVSPSPFFASSTSAHRPSLAQVSSGSTRALPPFAQRPPSSASNRPVGMIDQPFPALSPLYSSASSSDPDPAESYITFGLGLGLGNTRGDGREIDPFSRFWGMLEECLDEVSKPVAFASAPLNKDQGDLDGDEPVAGSSRKSLKGKDKLIGRPSEIERTASPSDSYYMISTDASSVPIPRKERQGSTSTKTPEELALENESLRASLDALALHTEAVDKENQELKKRSQEREAVLRTVAAGVRKEAEKARLDTSVLLRSQVLGASRTIEAVRPRRTGQNLDTGDKSGDSVISALRQKVAELEEENKNLKGENEKQKGSILKYKERFEKIKSTARAKKEAHRVGETKNQENG